MGIRLPLNIVRKYIQHYSEKLTFFSKAKFVLLLINRKGSRLIICFSSDLKVDNVWHVYCFSLS